MKATKSIILSTGADTFNERNEPRKAFWVSYNNMKDGDIETINYYGVGLNCRCAFRSDYGLL